MMSKMMMMKSNHNFSSNEHSIAPSAVIAACEAASIEIKLMVHSCVSSLDYVNMYIDVALFYLFDDHRGVGLTID